MNKEFSLVGSYFVKDTPSTQQGGNSIYGNNIILGYVESYDVHSKMYSCLTYNIEPKQLEQDFFEVRKKHTVIFPVAFFSGAVAFPTFAQFQAHLNFCKMYVCDDQNANKIEITTDGKYIANDGSPRLTIQYDGSIEHAIKDKKEAFINSYNELIKTERKEPWVDLYNSMLKRDERKENKLKKEQVEIENSYSNLKGLYFINKVTGWHGKIINTASNTFTCEIPVADKSAPEYIILTANELRYAKLYNDKGRYEACLIMFGMKNLVHIPEINKETPNLKMCNFNDFYKESE